MNKINISTTIYNIIKFIYINTIEYIFTILTIFYSKKPKNHSNKILFIANDGIGDNIIRISILRKYIEFFKTEDIYFLVSNDSGQRDFFYLVFPEKEKLISCYSKNIARNPLYRLSKINELNQYKFYKTILLHTKSERVTNIFKKYIHTKELYYHFSENPCSYTLKEDIELFQKVTNITLTINEIRPDLTYLIKNESNTYRLPKEFIAIGIGSSAIARTYPVSSFLTVLEWLAINGQYLVFLGKGQSDSMYYNTLIKHSPLIAKHSTNYIDKLSLSESLMILKQSKLFVGIESGLFNAAYVLNVPFAVIYGGGHYGRFIHPHDYSAYISNRMECFGCNWEKCGYGNIRLKPARCITSITPEQVIESISHLLLINTINIQ
ncbi:glycosyltransferase family 9 protein [Spirosoma sp. 48-14]|uniref:glycosyltransferase family 9 protein n=1 Tax=Spirosoma sp. 48-14 TaxID=1895854 RepID=UPI0009690BC3|nr:glycosyltransferase family 9 protein [Spirosoma sp. 48-14]OJW75143.1 MAG: hypothetical protein BGO59_17750 [Spirosoma sp. 48-14]